MDKEGKMGKVTAEEMQGLMYGNSNNTARGDGSSPQKVSASDMENLMAPYRSQEIKHTVLSPGTQPAQAAPAGASSRKQSETMKQNVDTLKKQRDDALIKAGAYSRAGNMQQQAKEQQKIANKAAIEYENAYTQWKNQRNAEAVEDYNPDENKFKVGDAALSGVQNAFQSMRQYAAAASSYLSGNPEAQAWEAKRLMDSGVSGTEAVKRAGLADKREIPITDYKTQAELRHEKNVASVGAVEGGALQLVNTISNMVPSLVANAVLPGSGLPMMAASAAGNKYVDAYEKYGNTDMAFALGSAAGAASMLTEQLGGVYGKMGGTKLGQAVSKKLMNEAPGLYNIANSVGGKWLRDAISEGVEEGAEDIINYAIEKSLTGESDEMDNFGYDILLGALAGGVMGGANAATRAVNYNRLGKTLKKSPAAVQQQIEEGLSKGEGTAPAIYAAEAQKKPTPQMLGRLFEANQSFDVESGLSKIQGDITQLSIRELKAMMNNANAIVQAAETLGVKPTPESVMTEVFSKQKEAAIRTAQDGVEQAFSQMVDNPANAGEVAYNSAIQGAPANQSAAQKVYNDPAARESFAKLAGIEYTGNPAADIAAIEVATKKLGETGRQVVSEAEYTERMTEAVERATAELEAKAEAEADVLEQESRERWLSIEQNTDIDIDGKRHVREITDTDVRGNSEISYKKAEIPNSKKPAVNAVEGAAKYLGKTIVWFEGAVQVNGQYRLTNGYRAPDGTIYVNINSRDPLMVTFGHEMFHDLVADSKYSGLIDTLVENPDYADMVNGMMNAKTELYERNGIELDPNAAAEEVAADISGDLLGSRDMLEYIGARNTEAATGIRGFLNRILKKLKGKPSAQEAYERLSESQRALIDGMEGRTEAEEAGKISYSLMKEAVEKNNRPFAEQFADYKAGRFKRGDLFYLNDTSEYLQAAGMKKEPIVMMQAVVEKAQRKSTIDTHGHSLSDNVLLKLPEMLDKPVLLLKSGTVPNAAVIVTSTADSDGNPVVVALHLSRSNGFDIVTRVASLYGKENSRDFLADQMLRGNLLGYSKKEANRLLHRIGLQLPERNTAVDFDTINVPQDTDVVNNYSMQNSAEDASGKFSLIGVSNDGLEIYETSLATQQLSESQKKKQYLALIKNQYRGRTARLERNGHVVYVRPDIQEAGKPIYGDRRSTANGAKALRNSLAEGDVFDLLENAEYDRSSRDTKNHKNADYFDYYVKTVQIDGKVYDLVADVKRAYGNSDGLYYTLYLVDNATKKAVVSQRPQTLGSSEPITASEMGSNSFSADMVPQSDTAVNNYSMQNSAEDANGKHSLMDIPAMDSTGRELSAEQREYFKDSKVRDEDGNLLVVYHGTDADFTVFDASKGRANMDIQGMFFSPWELDAQGYGSNVSAYYLDIKNPASEAVGYKALNRFKGQNNAGVKAREYLQNLGYDGVNNGNEEYIAFEPNQIKRIDNLTPTESKDIRYSLMDTDSTGRELSSEQKKFFAGSKVIDGNGNLLVMYHGTTAFGYITKFKRGKKGWLGPGIYLTSKRSDAQRYADAMGEGNGRLYEMYANITKPLVVTDGNPVPGILKAAYGRDSVYKSRSEKQANDPSIVTQADINKLRAKGYDGIVWDYGGNKEVSVFSPEQVKLADNVDPTSSQDIRYFLMEDAHYMDDIDKAVAADA
jgi:hypothetical protein